MIKEIKKADNKLLVSNHLELLLLLPELCSICKRKRKMNLVVACANRKDEQSPWIF